MSNKLSKSRRDFLRIATTSAITVIGTSTCLNNLASNSSAKASNNNINSYKDISNTNFSNEEIKIAARDRMPIPPKPLEAKADITFMAVRGKIEVQPTSHPYNKYYFDSSHWGGGVIVGSSLGRLQTVYGSWIEFFYDCYSYSMYSGAASAGVLQINWYNERGDFVGEYTGVIGGFGTMAASGTGKWQEL